MSYKLLSSVYYENQEKYDELYFSRLNSENTVRLNFKIHDNPAFYCITSRLHEWYIKIFELNMKVQNLIRELPPVALSQFANDSLIDEIVLTNNMEGVHSTRREIDGVLRALSKGDKKKRFYGLVNKYNMISNVQLSLETCEDIRRIYDELVFQEVKEADIDNVPDGQIFRKDLAEVTSQTGKTIHKGLYPEKEIIHSMNQALSILNGTTPLIERIAVFHYLMGYIHPFYDGNGRLSRFISSYLLSKNFNNNLIGYRLSYTIKENISNYYEAFNVCNNEKNKGDLTPFVLMFTQIVLQSMENLMIALTKRLNKLNECTEKMSKLSCFKDKNLNTIAYILIQAKLFSENGITKSELKKKSKYKYFNIK